MVLKRYFSERPLRLPRFKPYVPRHDDPPIYWFNSERDDIIREVVARVVDARRPPRDHVLRWWHAWVLERSAQRPETT